MWDNYVSSHYAQAIKQKGKPSPDKLLLRYIDKQKLPLLTEAEKIEKFYQNMDKFKGGGGLINAG